MGRQPTHDPHKRLRQPRQLALDLAPAPGFDRENFLVSGSNEHAYRMIEAWPDWPDPVLLLIGPPGAGKSHLGAIWAAAAGARTLLLAQLRQNKNVEPVSGSTGSQAAPDTVDVAALVSGPLLVEDLDRGDPTPTLLFHLLNCARERGVGLVLTARSPPEAWGLALPDLVSRLRLAPRAEIAPADDALMRAVLVKLLVERQLVVDARLVAYAALRLGRSLDAARHFVDEVDRRALSLKAPITRSLVAEVIGALTRAGEERECGDCEDGRE
jgi:chromosomal replication initiation ATPase DnaA